MKLYIFIIFHKSNSTISISNKSKLSMELLNLNSNILN